MAEVQLFNFLLIANDLLTAALFTGILDDTMRFWSIEDQFRTLDMGTSEFTLSTVTPCTAIHFLLHLLAICEGLATVMALGGVLFLDFIAIVLDRTTLFLVISSVFDGLTANLSIMFRHFALGDLTFRHSQDNEAMQDGKDAETGD